ncbi:MAG: ATP-grasp domain-containing protein [Deltaproteobacteria bacterium]
MTFDLTVAVTGLNATDNPGPGVGVIRALRAHPDFRGNIAGLAYDALEPGLYSRGLADDVFLIPYPSQGPQALRDRIAYIRERVGIDVIIPTLDAELPSFVELADDLARDGVGMLLPSAEQLELRAKTRLVALGEHGIPVPASCVLTDVTQLYTMHERIPFPLVVKGPYYGAKVAHTLDEAVVAFHRMVAEWGYPVIVQQFVAGEEVCIVAVGDGEGGLVGAVQMRKTVITDKGKGWAGVTIRDAGLDALTATFMRVTKWRGPCELEVIRDPRGGYHVLEINPRFPAWSYLSAGAGMNLPFAVAQLAAGQRVEPMQDYRVGTMFVRIAIDQITDMAGFSRISTAGELVRTQGVSP